MRNLSGRIAAAAAENVLLSFNYSERLSGVAVLPACLLVFAVVLLL